MKQCNRCGNIRCTLIKAEYPPIEVNGETKGAGMRNHHTIPAWAMNAPCKQYIPPVAWKTTIFERMAVDQPEVLIQLLNRYGMRVQDKKKYPYFRLVGRKVA